MGKLDEMNANWSLQDQVEGLSSEDAIEVCNAVIAETERIIEVCEQEIEDREDEIDESES